MAMRVIGLAGRPGSGKSAVARHLSSCRGIEWIDLDRLAWDTYRPGGDTFDRLVERFGRGILGEEGTIDRSRLAERALRDPADRDDLETIVHPAVMESLRREIEERRARGVDVLLVEGALLVHSRHVDRSVFDAIVWFDVRDRTRAKRLRAAGRSAHAARVRDPCPDRLAGVLRLSAEDGVADVAERLLRLIESA